jgi:hypothetical protein
MKSTTLLVAFWMLCIGWISEVNLTVVSGLYKYLFVDFSEFTTGTIIRADPYFQPMKGGGRNSWKVKYVYTSNEGTYVSDKIMFFHDFDETQRVLDTYHEGMEVKVYYSNKYSVLSTLEFQDYTDIPWFNVLLGLIMPVIIWFIALGRFTLKKVYAS